MLGTLALACSRHPAEGGAEARTLQAQTPAEAARPAVTARLEALLPSSSPPPLSPPPAASTRAAPSRPARVLSALTPALTQELGPAGVSKLDVATSVCAAALRRDARGALHVGCRACPPFTGSGLPDGRLVLDPPDPNFYELEALYAGSFSRPKADEAAAVFAGCEPHSENYGGTLLVERRGKRWVARSYRSGFHPERCEVAPRADAADLLVCEWATAHQGTVRSLLDSYDFALGDDTHVEAGWTNLVAIDDDASERCFDDPSDATEVSAGRIDVFHVDRQTLPASLRVGVHVAHGAKTPAYRAACATLRAESNKEHGRAIDVSATLVPRAVELVFVEHAGRFVPDARTGALAESVPATSR